MFQLTEEESRAIWFQTETSKLSRFQLETLNGRGHNIKYLPYVFTEQGVAMLATVIRTEVAEEMSVRIMDAFVAMKRYISTSLIEQKHVNELVYKDHDRINLIEDSLKKFEQKTRDFRHLLQWPDIRCLFQDL